jgi:hypothetical protein
MFYLWMDRLSHHCPQSYQQAAGINLDRFSYCINARLIYVKCVKLVDRRRALALGANQIEPLTILRPSPVLVRPIQQLCTERKKNKQFSLPRARFFKSLILKYFILSFPAGLLQSRAEH